MLDLIKIGETLKSYRIKHHLSQEALALKLFVSHQAISRWETGKSLPSLDSLVALSKLYEAPLETLLCYSIHYEDDLDLLFSNHTRTHIIDEVIKGTINALTLEDILHKLSKEERYYALNKSILSISNHELSNLFMRLSFSERRFVIDKLVKKSPNKLNTLYPLLKAFERKYIKENSYENH
ncbi:MAG: helix-turn-helix transcriptional regulator [Candidatus Izemoplasmataceae bacterium]